MDHLQTDIDSLETERGQLKEKLKSFGKKTMISTSGADISVGNSSFIAAGIQTANDKLLMQEVTLLKEALNNEHLQKRKLLSDALRIKLENLKPLTCMKNPETTDANINELEKKTNNLLKVSVNVVLLNVILSTSNGRIKFINVKIIFQDIHNVITFPTVPDLTRNKASSTKTPVLEKSKPIYQLLQRQILIKQYKEKADRLAVSYQSLAFLHIIDDYSH